MLSIRLEPGVSAQITVLNLAGQIMARSECTQAVVELNAQGWQSGCYLVRVQAGQHQETLRWLIKN